MSGAFGNLYDESIGDQCTEIRIIVDYVNDPSPSSSLVLPASTTLSLIPTGGPAVTLSSSASGVSSAASSSASNNTASSGSSASSASRTASSASGSATGSTSNSASGSATGSSSPTASGAAPPAEGGAVAASPITQGTVLGALFTIFGAALML